MLQHFHRILSCTDRRHLQLMLQRAVSTYGWSGKAHRRELIPSEELSTLYHVFPLLPVYAAACTLDTHSDCLLAISPIQPVRIQTLTQHLRMGACVRASGQPTNGDIILLGAYKVF